MKRNRETETIEGYYESLEGYGIEYEVLWEFEGFDGIGEYEYWGQICNDQGKAIWNVANIKFLSATDEDGNEVDIASIPTEYIKGWMEDIEENAEFDN
jgi:hypothetical protein